MPHFTLIDWISLALVVLTLLGVSTIVLITILWDD